MLYPENRPHRMPFDHLCETASPGGWERTGRQLAVEQGRAMTVYAPDLVP